MKIQFYKQHRNKDYWQILEDLHYNTSYGRVIVPAWFVLDMGSIPMSSFPENNTSQRFKN